MKNENVDPPEDPPSIPDMLYIGFFMATGVGLLVSLAGYLVGLDKGKDQKDWKKYTGRFAALLAIEWAGVLALDKITKKFYDKQLAADLAKQRTRAEKGDNPTQEIGLMKRICNALISGTTTLLYAVGLSGLSWYILKDRSVTFSYAKETLKLNKKRSLLTAGVIAGAVEGAYVLGAIADDLGHKKQPESFAQRLDLEQKEAAQEQRSR